MSQEVRITGTACNFGGSRPWFQCPRCWRRVGILFMRSGNFICRHCGRVAYASQSADCMGRAWIKQQKAERRLGEGWARPKGMHNSTHQKLLAAIIECEERRNVALAMFIERHFPGWRAAEADTLVDLALRS